MSPAQYATGVALLVLFTAPLAAGAWAARRVLVPHWQGAPARLAEAVLALGALLTIAELLGAAGQLRRAPLAVACVVVGAAVVVLCRAPTPLRPQTRKERSGRPRFDLATVLALAMAAAVTAQWWARSLSALDGGITEIDSRQYHLTFAGFFAQTGSTVSQHVAWLDPVWSYYPAHAEVVHAVGMVAFGHDVLSPVINLGWLAMAFLAAWCVGLRWGVAPGTLAAMALLAGTPLMATLESGTATNDIAALALLLSAVAFLVVEELTPGSLGLAGGAAGLALGTKLSLVYPVAVLTVGAVVLARRFGVVRAVLTWGTPLVVGAAYWYVRNIVVAANPVPAVHVSAGPLHLSGPFMASVRAYGYRVVDYASDGHFWRSVVVPNLHSAFGIGWLAVLVLAVVGAVGALVQRRTLPLQVLGATAVVAAIGYTLTPGSAYGIHGQAELFGPNLRYLTPALALGLGLVPLVPVTHRSPQHRAAVVVGLAALLAVTVLSGRGKTAGWPPHHHVLALALGAGAVAVAAWLLTTHTRAVASAIAAALVGLVVVVGYPIQRNYLHRRYAVGVQVDRWARSVHGARIGMVGYPAQYPLLGLDLTNRVEYVGARVAYGGIQTAKTCSQWRRFVDRADYDFVVTGTNKWGLEQAHETAWTRGDPNAVEVLQSPAASVFALRGRLDPGRC